MSKSQYMQWHNNINDDRYSNSKRDSDNEFYIRRDSARVILKRAHLFASKDTPSAPLSDDWWPVWKDQCHLVHFNWRKRVQRLRFCQQIDVILSRNAVRLAASLSHLFALSCPLLVLAPLVFRTRSVGFLNRTEWVYGRLFVAMGISSASTRLSSRTSSLTSYTLDDSNMWNVSPILACPSSQNGYHASPSLGFLALPHFLRQAVLSCRRWIVCWNRSDGDFDEEDQRGSPLWRSVDFIEESGSAPSSWSTVEGSFLRVDGQRLWWGQNRDDYIWVSWEGAWCGQDQDRWVSVLKCDLGEFVLLIFARCRGRMMALWHCFNAVSARSGVNIFACRIQKWFMIITSDTIKASRASLQTSGTCHACASRGTMSHKTSASHSWRMQWWTQSQICSKSEDMDTEEKNASQLRFSLLLISDLSVKSLTNRWYQPEETSFFSNKISLCLCLSGIFLLYSAEELLYGQVLFFLQNPGCCMIQMFFFWQLVPDNLPASNHTVWLQCLMVCQNSNPSFCVYRKSNFAVVIIKICKELFSVRFLRIEESALLLPYDQLLEKKTPCLPSLSKSDSFCSGTSFTDGLVLLTLHWSHEVNLSVFVLVQFFQTCLPVIRVPVDGPCEPSAMTRESFPRNCSIWLTRFWWTPWYLHHSRWQFKRFAWFVLDTRNDSEGNVSIFRSPIGIATCTAGGIFTEIACVYGMDFTGLVNGTALIGISFHRNFLYCGIDDTVCSFNWSLLSDWHEDIASLDLEQNFWPYPWKVSEVILLEENLIPDFSLVAIWPLILMQKPHPVPISRDGTCGLPSCGFWEHTQFAFCRNFLDMPVQSTTDNHPGFWSNSTYGIDLHPWARTSCYLPIHFFFFGGRVITHML